MKVLNFDFLAYGFTDLTSLLNRKPSGCEMKIGVQTSHGIASIDYPRPGKSIIRNSLA